MTSGRSRLRPTCARQGRILDATNLTHVIDALMCYATGSVPLSFSQLLTLVEMRTAARTHRARILDSNTAIGAKPSDSLLPTPRANSTPIRP